jgi:hypothetical protein
MAHQTMYIRILGFAYNVPLSGVSVSPCSEEAQFIFPRTLTTFSFLLLFPFPFFGSLHNNFRFPTKKEERRKSPKYSLLPSV